MCAEVRWFVVISVIRLLASRTFDLYIIGEVELHSLPSWAGTVQLQVAFSSLPAFYTLKVLLFCVFYFVSCLVSVLFGFFKICSVSRSECGNVTCNSLFLYFS